MALLIKETVEKFGYDPTTLKSMSGRRVVYSCLDCGKKLESQMSTYTKSNKICLSCSLKRTHKNPNSGFKKESYHKLRSEIAIRSNKNRKIKSEKFKKYLPFIEDLKNHKISFTEIGKILGLDDSSVCHFFHKNFDIKSKINYSIQERKVLQNLKELFPDVEEQKRYSQDNKQKSDFYISQIGHIEYDGNGFFHQLKKSDIEKDDKFKPIRLNAQAYHGGIDYLKWKLLNQKSGYCSANHPQEYTVRLIDNRKESTRMLENCHPLGNCAGTKVFGLFYQDKLIGAAKFGLPTNKDDNGMLELRRFFVLDGTPRNTESYFLRQCEKKLPNEKLVTFIHHFEKGSYLKALGWKIIKNTQMDYDSYLINGNLISKRKFWGWAKKTGLVDKFGTTDAKNILCELLNGQKIIQPSKIKFIKIL